MEIHDKTTRKRLRGKTQFNRWQIIAAPSDPIMCGLYWYFIVTYKLCNGIRRVHRTPVLWNNRRATSFVISICSFSFHGRYRVVL